MIALIQVISDHRGRERTAAISSLSPSLHCTLRRYRTPPLAYLDWRREKLMPFTHNSSGVTLVGTVGKGDGVKVQLQHERTTYSTCREVGGKYTTTIAVVPRDSVIGSSK